MENFNMPIDPVFGDLDNLENLIKFLEHQKKHHPEKIAMAGAKLLMDEKNSKFLTFKGTGILENFVIQHNFEFQRNVLYSDAEGNEETRNKAIDLSESVAKIKVSLVEGNFTESEEDLNIFKSQIDEFLNLNLQIFVSYGTYAHQYYNFLGCLEVTKENFENARSAFIKSMVYECLYRIGSLSADTVKKIVSWHKNNSPCMLNFNRISDKKIKNPFVEVKFKNLARILISYLLFLSESEILSHAAYWAYTTYIKNLLKISEKYGDFYLNKDARTAIKNLIVDKRDYEKMTLDEWQSVTPALESLLNSLSGTTSIEELAQEISARYN